MRKYHLSCDKSSRIGKSGFKIGLHKFLNGPGKAGLIQRDSSVGWFRQVKWQLAAISVGSFGLGIQLRVLQADLGADFEMRGF